MILASYCVTAGAPFIWIPADCDVLLSNNWYVCELLLSTFKILKNGWYNKPALSNKLLFPSLKVNFKLPL